MANFLEELYYGNVDPQARGTERAAILLRFHRT